MENGPARYHDKAVETMADTQSTREYPEVRQLSNSDESWPPDRQRRGGWGPIKAFFFLVAVIALIGAVLVGFKAIDLLPNFGKPFAERTTDRSQPVLLKSIQDMSRYIAATGNFEVVVDTEKDRAYVPNIIFSERVLFIGAGTVDAYVDFSKLATDALTVSQDQSTVTVKLPAPQLAKPNINHDRSYVFAEQRGIINRISDFFSSNPNEQRDLYLLAEKKIADAAGKTELIGRAQDNTEKMLKGMLTTLGFTEITINWQLS
jgi:hypothetical protein